MMMAEFKEEVESFLAETGMKPSGFGRKALNDPGFVFRLREGAECRVSTVIKVRKVMARLRQPKAVRQ
ncbi:hypothetical protein [Leisingera sp. JC11]|uniref:hypothetical protein n=1 Tax=Leisingera sp. JC11 TaxID=3042469 RepID=UPI003453C56B